MGTRRNLCTNPAAANNVTGFISNGGGGGYTPTRVTTLASPWLRTTGARATTTASGDFQLGSASAVSAIPLDGLYLSGTFQWMTSAVPSGGASSVIPYMPNYNSAGTYLNNSAIIAAPVAAANTVYQTTLAGLATAGSYRFNISIYLSGAATNTVLTVSSVRLEIVNDPNMLFADGGSTGWVWDGTSGGSTSTRSVDDPGAFWLLGSGP